MPNRGRIAFSQNHGMALSLRVTGRSARSRRSGGCRRALEFHLDWPLGGDGFFCYQRLLHNGVRRNLPRAWLAIYGISMASSPPDLPSLSFCASALHDLARGEGISWRRQRSGAVSDRLGAEPNTDPVAEHDYASAALGQ